MRPLWVRRYFLIYINCRSRYVCFLHNRNGRRGLPMLDVAFILIGAVFLGACVLYALACDRL
jgi:hypothetical protein